MQVHGFHADTGTHSCDSLHGEQLIDQYGMGPGSNVHLFEYLTLDMEDVTNMFCLCTIPQHCS